MRKLLSANFSRLWKNKIFWLAVAYMSLGSVFFSYLNYINSMKYSNNQIYVEDLLFNLLPMLSFVCVFFISLYLGTEFDDNTIRNKIIVGHTRTHVFFAEYVTCMVASILLAAAMLLFSGVSGYVFFHEFLLDWKTLTYMVLCSILLAAVFSAMCVGIGMNIHSKASSVVASLLFMFAILFLASYCGNALSAEPQTYSYVAVTVDGVQFCDLIDNPEYVSGFKRTVYQFIYDLLPTGQSIQLNNMEFENAARWPVLSAVMLAVSTAAGFIPFRKRDIR